MASFGCQVDPVKTSRKVTAIRISWWRKDVYELKEAYAELQRPRVGRKARIANVVELVNEDDTPTLL